jgi:hypothetical protein
MVDFKKRRRTKLADSAEFEIVSVEKKNGNEYVPNFWSYWFTSILQ